MYRRALDLEEVEAAPAAFPSVRTEEGDFRLGVLHGLSIAMGMFNRGWDYREIKATLETEVDKAQIKLEELRR